MEPTWLLTAPPWLLRGAFAEPWRHQHSSNSDRPWLECLDFDQAIYKDVEEAKKTVVDEMGMGREAWTLASKSSTMLRYESATLWGHSGMILATLYYVRLLRTTGVEMLRPTIAVRLLPLVR